MGAKEERAGLRVTRDALEERQRIADAVARGRRESRRRKNRVGRDDLL